MSAPVPKRVILAVTSENPKLGDHKTGLFISEALHPFNVFEKNGFEVDFVSETGKWAPDDMSLQPDWLSAEEKAVYEDHNSEFRTKLDQIKTPAQVNSADYGLFFASAGHAALVDYPVAEGLKKIAVDIWQAGGIVSAVCHGGAIFVNMLLPDGKHLIEGKKVTGFTTKGEIELTVLDEIKSWNKPTIEEGAAAAGATYVSPAGPWDAFAVVDGRLVTGVNPQSATKTAEDAVEAFNKL